MTFLKNCVICLMVLVPGAQQLRGQAPVRSDTIQLFHEHHLFPDKAMRDTMPAHRMHAHTSVVLYTANGREDLEEIGTQLESIPYVVVKRQSFLEGAKAVKGLQSKITEYGKLDLAYQQLDSIEQERWAVLDTIIKEERNRTQLFIKSNQQLNTQIDSLNSQFLAASDVTRQALKGRNAKTWKMGFMGGVIGLSVGMILGILGTN